MQVSALSVAFAGLACDETTTRDLTGASDGGVTTSDAGESMPDGGERVPDGGPPPNPSELGIEVLFPTPGSNTGDVESIALTFEVTGFTSAPEIAVEGALEPLTRISDHRWATRVPVDVTTSSTAEFVITATEGAVTARTVAEFATVVIPYPTFGNTTGGLTPAVVESMDEQTIATLEPRPYYPSRIVLWSRATATTRPVLGPGTWIDLASDTSSYGFWVATATTVQPLGTSGQLGAPRALDLGDRRLSAINALPNSPDLLGLTSNAILRISPVSGAVSVLSGEGIGSGPTLEATAALSVHPEGRRAFVLMGRASPERALVEVDLETGARQILEVGNLLRYYLYPALFATSDKVYVGWPSVRVDLAGGEHGTFSGFRTLEGEYLSVLGWAQPRPGSDDVLFIAGSGPESGRLLEVEPSAGVMHEVWDIMRRPTVTPLFSDRLSRTLALDPIASEDTLYMSYGHGLLSNSLDLQSPLYNMSQHEQWGNDTLISTYAVTGEGLLFYLSAPGGWRLERWRGPDIETIPLPTDFDSSKAGIGWDADRRHLWLIGDDGCEPEIYLRDEEAWSRLDVDFSPGSIDSCINGIEDSVFDFEGGYIYTPRLGRIRMSDGRVDVLANGETYHSPVLTTDGLFYRDDAFHIYRVNRSLWMDPAELLDIQRDRSMRYEVRYGLTGDGRGRLFTLETVIDIHSGDQVTSTFR